MVAVRIGLGYDVHRFTENRKLVLGGVEIPFERGLLGHSDADVLTHAIMDAIIGALGQGDLGKWFPDSDPKYKDISSLKLLSIVIGKMEQAGYQIGNLDALVIAERPKIGPYREEMRETLAKAMHCTIESVNVKATTEEHLGFTGREEGMAAEAVCLLEKKQS